MFLGVAVEFGTVIVYTCSASCWDVNASHCTEGVLVQPDPDEPLFHKT